MINTLGSIQPSFFPGLSKNTTIPVYSVSSSNVEEIRQLLGESPHVGVAVVQSNTGVLTSLCLATVSSVFVFDLESKNQHFLSAHWFRDVLYGRQSTLVAFHIARLALRLRSYFKHHIRGVDLSTLCAGNTRKPWPPSKLVDKTFGCMDTVTKFKVDKLWHSGTLDNEAWLRAWISAKRVIVAARKVDTSSVPKMVLKQLQDFAHEADLMDDAKPKQTARDFSGVPQMNKDGSLVLTNARYTTRVRRSNQAMVVMTDSKGKMAFGNTQNTEGRKTNIKMLNGGLSGEISSVHVEGIDEPTNSERARDELILLALRGEKVLQDSQPVRLIWFPTPEDMDQPRKSHHLGNRYAGSSNLNDSQKEVVAAMMSESILTIVHGPPGTGKTTTIAAAAKIWENQRLPVWIVAHSNVAVKNIAEKLEKEDVDFKLLVSKEFYVEWHEHIYERIQRNTLRVDELPKHKVALVSALCGSRIILSTISALSNPGLDDNHMFRIVPVERLVIDEASQIGVFDYLFIFHKFKSLEKVCFFGDPQQLPPFGQETSQKRSIFDVKHLQINSSFLDTQYRMPVPIGGFISKAVYNGRIKSVHTILTPSCLAFIDAQGQEIKRGFSWTVRCSSLF
ncbi:P-loop containing nucleoside triphosphate hydrolase protein [Mycena floridula]|nr:P-loop containing nucleoside triphosphate hydrolase protein [Mycena floridula]